MKFEQLREKLEAKSKFPAPLVSAAVKIALDMGGNHTGAVRKIEKMKKGLSDDPTVSDALRQANESKLAEALVNENKIFFVKVGDGRDSMTVKTKAPNKKEALKKMRDEYPKSKVSLDINQKQGQPAGAFESVKEETSQFMITVRKGGPGGKDLNMKVMGKDKNDAVMQWRKTNKKYKNDEVEVKEL